MSKIKKLVVAIIGGGGREHVLAEWYGKSERVERLVLIPGNPFIKDSIEKQFGKKTTIYPQFKTSQKNEILQVIHDERVDFVDVAQDNGIEAGVADATRKLGIPTVGPGRLAGEIEWGKDFLRKQGKDWGINQPDFTVWKDEKAAIAYLKGEEDKAYFVKAAGLAEGKGALPAENREEAIEKIKQLRMQFPQAASTFLLEEWLRNEDGTAGEEFSHFVLSDGKTFQFIRNGMDYKRAFDHDEGENTGSMGSNSPTNLLSQKQVEEVDEKITRPIIQGLAKMGRAYKGWLYISGMKIKRGGEEQIYVIETNARLGDPEAQVIIPAIQNDAIEIGLAVSEGTLDKLAIQRDKKVRVVVAFASKGYPGNYSAVKGKEVIGFSEARNVQGVSVYGAGLGLIDEKYVVAGGRLLYVVGEGKTLKEAQKKAYQGAQYLKVEGENGENLGFMRTDIGSKDLKRTSW